MRASGLEQVLGLAFRRGQLYALEMSTTPGGPDARAPARSCASWATARRPRRSSPGLTFPTGMTVGPDGAFYVSEQGFGFGAGQGQILRITL